MHVDNGVVRAEYASLWCNEVVGSILTCVLVNLFDLEL
jgi:hypothetical protein